MKADKIILGEGAVFSTDCKKTGLNNNILVCGTAGSGKTLSIIEPRLINAENENLIVTVTKYRIVEQYTEYLIQRGFQVQELNFANPERSTVSYDPLACIGSLKDISYLAESIVMADPRKKDSRADPYWDQAATSLLSAEIYLTLAKKVDATFADVIQLHRSLRFESYDGKVRTSLDDEFETLEKAAPDCYGVMCWQSFSNLPIRTAGCVYGSLNVCLDTIFTDEILDLIRRKPMIDIESFVKSRNVLFIVTSPVNPALNCLVSIFYSFLFKELFEYGEAQPNGMLPIPVALIADDFATGGRVLNFSEYIAIFREKRISATILLQSESQLEAMYGSSECVNIVNNFDTYCFLGCNDIGTARRIAERLNQPLEDILYLPVGKLILFRRGQKPIITERYHITEDAEYLKILKDYRKRIDEKEEDDK